MAGWGSALKKTRHILKRVFAPGAAAQEALQLEEIEEILLRADVPSLLVMDILDELERAGSAQSHRENLRRLLVEALGDPGTLRLAGAGRSLCRAPAGSEWFRQNDDGGQVGETGEGGR
jgi:hypothetical protein